MEGSNRSTGVVRWPVRIRDGLRTLALAELLLGLLATGCGIAVFPPAAGAQQDSVLRIQRGADGETDHLTFGEFRGEAELGRSGTDAGELTVELKDGARLFGMREFGIRAARDAMAEMPVLEELRSAGVLAPRQIAVRVSLDGGAPVAHRAQEGFSKELAESQQRRDGVMFRFDSNALPELRIVPFRAKKVRESKQRSAQLATAEGLLAGYFHGDLAIADVFDLDSTSAFFAVAELYCAEAMLALPNLRFYFNPVIQRIEPVGYRAIPGPTPAADGWITKLAPWSARLLQDPPLAARFAQRLRDVARAIVERDSAGALATGRARAFENRALPKYVAIVPTPFVRPDAVGLRSNPIPRASLAEVAARHPFLEWIESRRVFKASPGNWDVQGSLVLPEGVGLELSAGTTLRFEPDALLLASGPLRFEGTEPSPVVLAPLAQSWQGIVVLDSAQPHTWNHVIVRQTSGVGRGSWKLPGGVTFRASEVEISSTRLEDSAAEDALNLIRSRFSFSDVSISGAASDAFDCDFCRGTIRGGRIERVGGDGIDVSGSEIEVEGVYLAEIRDKAVSVGEQSQVTARRLTIDSVGTAAASKDGSELVIEDSRVSGVGQTALMAYTKKAEYGPARLEARGLTLVGVDRPAAVQHGSRLSIDGEPRETEALDVDRLYQDGPMKK